MAERARKICVIVPTHWEAKMGGAQYQAKLLIERLLSLQKFEISFLARRIDPAFSPKGYHIVRIAEPKGYRRYGYFFDAFRLLQILEQIRPDVIYQRVSCAYTGIAAYFAKRRDCRIIWHISSDKDVLREARWTRRSFLPHHYVENKIFEYGVEHAEYIVAQTDYQADLLKRNYQRTATAVIRNFHPFPRERVEKGLPVKVVWIANFKPLKQPELFIRLAQDCQSEKNLQFLIIGTPATGRNARWQEGLIAQMGKLDNLDYLGQLTQDEVNEVLSKSHILVNTSLYEGFSNTFIQAWMRRVLVVTLNVNPDGLLDGGDLGYCAHGDYREMRSHILQLAQKLELIEIQGASAERYAFEKFSERNIDQFIELFER